MHVVGPFLKRVPTPLCPGLAGGGVVGKETQHLASNAGSLQLQAAEGTQKGQWVRCMRAWIPRSSSSYLSQDQGLKTLRQAGVA